MAPRPPVPKTVRVELNWVATPNNNQAHNIFYIQSPGSANEVPPSDLGSIANALASTGTGHFPNSIAYNVASNWSLATITVSDNGGSEATTTATVGYAGAATPPSLPPQCAVCASFAIAARYKGGHPRMYLPGVPSGALTSNNWSQLTSSYAGLVQTEVTNALDWITSTTVEGSTLVPGTISYTRNKVPLTTPVFYAYGLVTVHERLDSQRRRSGKEVAFGSVT